MDPNIEKDKYSDNGSGSDAVAEKQQFKSSRDAEQGEIKTVELKRKLQSRHLQMIAIGMIGSLTISCNDL